MQDCDRQDQAFREMLTEKLSRLRRDVCVGNGHAPRSSTDSTHVHAVPPQYLLDRDIGLDLFEADPRRRHHALPRHLDVGAAPFVCTFPNARQSTNKLAARENE
jgi:hypothetical protein